MKPGWTLHEMIISLVVASAIVALAAGAAAGQLRFFRGVGEVSAVRSQVTQAALIAANILRDVGTRADLLAATDSMVEASVTIGSAVTCAADTGRLRVTRAEPSGPTLASFVEEPQPGDAAHVFIPDSAGSWLRLTVAARPDATPCARFPGSAGWSIAVSEPFVVPAGAPVRFTRRTRISLYRAADGRWYLGLKEWNGALARFNAIQPVAGPLAEYSGRAGASGLHLQFRDDAGAPLSAPVDPRQVALVTIRARGESVRPARVPGMASDAAPFHGDSIAISVAVRRP